MPIITEHNGSNQQQRRTTSLSQDAYEAIKHRIISLQLAPGSVIDEAALRADLELGRTPIREALQRLSMEKLVTIIPRRGTFVTDIRITDLQRLFEARLCLETFAVRLACQRGTSKHWTEMEKALAGLPEAEDRANNAVLIAIDEACHEIIYDASDNTFLQDTLIALYALSLRLWYFSLAQVGGIRTAILEHERILVALQARDADLAAQLMEQHIHTFQHEIRHIVLDPPVSN